MACSRTLVETFARIAEEQRLADAVLADAFGGWDALSEHFAVQRQEQREFSKAYARSLPNLAASRLRFLEERGGMSPPFIVDPYGDALIAEISLDAEIAIAVNDSEAPASSIDSQRSEIPTALAPVWDRRLALRLPAIDPQLAVMWEDAVDRIRGGAPTRRVTSPPACAPSCGTSETRTPPRPTLA